MAAAVVHRGLLQRRLDGIHADVADELHHRIDALQRHADDLVPLVRNAQYEHPALAVRKGCQPIGKRVRVESADQSVG